MRASIETPSASDSDSPPAPGNFSKGFARNRKLTSVALADAEAYCHWLAKKDGAFTYRLLTAEEWELAAGHMPKDADFNSKGERGGLSPVNAYSGTLVACGAIDFWDNA